jgi:hypothetical protein
MSNDDGTRRFPIQKRYLSDDPTSIAWSDADTAHRAYALLFSNAQTLKDLADRGGFGWVEFLALTDTAVWMRANPQTGSSGSYARQAYEVFTTALGAQAAMHPPRKR